MYRAHYLTQRRHYIHNAPSTMFPNCPESLNCYKIHRARLCKFSDTLLVYCWESILSRDAIAWRTQRHMHDNTVKTCIER